jgi:hypothetical protein
MDFFIPSLFVLLFSGILMFMVVPRLGPATMLVVSILLLAFAITHHIKMYKSEYTLSTWPALLTTYGPYIVLGTLLLFILFFIFSSYGSASVPIPESPSMPDTSSVVETANSIINKINNGIKNAVNTAKNSIIGPNNRKNNVSKSFFNVV